MGYSIADNILTLSLRLLIQIKGNSQLLKLLICRINHMPWQKIFFLARLLFVKLFHDLLHFCWTNQITRMLRYQAL